MFFFCDLCPTSVFKENRRETGAPGPLECDENTVNSVSDAMSPYRHKSHQKGDPGLHFGGVWARFGVTLATQSLP